MPIHDWSRVPAGIFHDFHHELIAQIKRALNGGLLPPDYYALAEQVAAGLGPDVLTLHTPPLGGNGDADRGIQRPADERGGGLLLAPPKTRPIAEAEMAYYRRKQSVVAVRHVSGDRVVAIVEVVSPGQRVHVERPGGLRPEGRRLPGAARPPPHHRSASPRPT